MQFCPNNMLDIVGMVCKCLITYIQLVQYYNRRMRFATLNVFAITTHDLTLARFIFNTKLYLHVVDMKPAAAQVHTIYFLSISVCFAFSFDTHKLLSLSTR